MTTSSSVYGESDRVYPVITYQVEPCFLYEGVTRVEVEMETGYLRPYYTRMQDLPDAEPKAMTRNNQLITLSDGQKAIIFDVLDKLPASFPKQPMGCCDGATYDLHIEVREYSLQCHYRWWCGLPEEWGNLQPLLDVLDTYITLEPESP